MQCSPSSFTTPTTQDTPSSRPSPAPLQPHQPRPALPRRHMTDLSGEEGKQIRAAVYERVLLVLPIYHIYGYNTTNGTAYIGGCLVLMGRFSFRSFLDAIQRHEVTGLEKTCLF